MYTMHNEMRYDDMLQIQFFVCLFLVSLAVCMCFTLSLDVHISHRLSANEGNRSQQQTKHSNVN